MRMALAGTDLTPLGERLLARAHSDAGDAAALLDMSTLLQLRGNLETALAVQAQALAVQRGYRAPGGADGLRLLALMAPGDLMANTPLECLLENSGVRLDLYYLNADDQLPAALEGLPEHDLLFVAIGESKANQPLLRRLQPALADWPKPVLNRPGLIAALARDQVYAALHGLPGIGIPPIVRLARADLERLGTGAAAPAAWLAGGAFPLLLRPVDSHAGHDLAKIETPAAVAEYLSQVPAGEFYLTPFVDYRSADGWFRKYRIVLIQGRPYACHMALSEHWMIHYLNAGMAENADKRAEEARFMAEFDQDFARRHAEALRAIQTGLGLDYLGLDCAETADGRLLIFEADSCMVVHAMDPPELFPYKQPQMHKVFAAFQAMLQEKLRDSL